MPPVRLAASLTAVIPTRTGPRKLAPIPLLTIVAPSLMDVPVTPRSVLPPLRPAAQAACASACEPWLTDGAAVVRGLPEATAAAPGALLPWAAPGATGTTAAGPPPTAAPDTTTCSEPDLVSVPNDRAATPTATTSKVVIDPSTEGPMRVMREPVHEIASVAR